MPEGEGARGPEEGDPKVCWWAPTVVVAMRQQADAADVQEWACATLADLSAEDETNQWRIADVGGIEAVVAAMRRHADAANVQEWACETLWSLATNSNNMNHKHIADAGGIEAVVAAMRRHADAAGVQELGCAMIWNLATDDDDVIHKHIANAGGIEVVVYQEFFGGAFSVYDGTIGACIFICSLFTGKQSHHYGLYQTLFSDRFCQFFQCFLVKINTWLELARNQMIYSNFLQVTLLLVRLCQGMNTLRIKMNITQQAT